MAQYDRNNQPYYPQSRDNLPPVYNHTTVRIQQADTPRELERVDCKPAYCYSPYAILRWFELVLFFIIHWLVEVVCGHDACTMILNEFGYKAYGQMYVVIAVVLLFFTTCCVMITYSMNVHNAAPRQHRSLEKVHTILAIVLMVPAAILGAYYAGKTVELSYDSMGRSSVRGQWIAAACLEWITVLVLVIDLIGQMTANYPHNVTWTERSK